MSDLPEGLRELAPGDVVPGYWLAPACLDCGGQLHHVAGGVAGTTVQATAECRPCERLYRLGAAMADITDEVGKPRDAQAKAEQRARKAAANAERVGEAEGVAA